jgi:hypothetical protein
MLATNFDIVRKLRAKITEPRLDRIMMMIEDAGTVLFIVAGVVAIYVLILVPLQGGH